MSSWQIPAPRVDSVFRARSRPWPSRTLHIPCLVVIGSSGLQPKKPAMSADYTVVMRYMRTTAILGIYRVPRPWNQKSGAPTFVPIWSLAASAKGVFIANRCFYCPIGVSRGSLYFCGWICLFGHTPSSAFWLAPSPVLSLSLLSISLSLSLSVSQPWGFSSLSCVRASIGWGEVNSFHELPKETKNGLVRDPRILLLFYSDVVICTTGWYI